MSYSVCGVTSSFAVLTPVITFWVFTNFPTTCHCTLYPVIPSPVSLGAVHDMSITCVKTEFAVGVDGWPGKPNKKNNNKGRIIRNKPMQKLTLRRTGFQNRMVRKLSICFCFLFFGSKI